jgi:hypothetical protein
LTGRFTGTSQPGSYNLVITAKGSSSNRISRFVRKALVSVIVK